MRAKQFLCFNNNGIWGERLARVWCIWAPGGLGCCPFWGGGSVVNDLLFYVPPIVCWGSVFVFVLVCITVYVLSSFAIILTRKRGCFCFCCLSGVLLL